MKRMMTILFCALMVLPVMAGDKFKLAYQSGDVPYQVAGGAVSAAGLEAVKGSVKLDIDVNAKKKELYIYNSYLHGIFPRVTNITLTPSKEFKTLDEALGDGKLAIKCDNDPGDFMRGKSFALDGTYKLSKNGDVYTLVMTITDAYGISLGAKMMAGKFNGKPVDYTLSFTVAK